ncbi:MAG: hypothetical protein JO228_13165 [Xanthobacteraceae bacterium]|nr:hypothetical protein [Xanthobacteraceae bacterium]
MQEGHFDGVELANQPGTMLDRVLALEIARVTARAAVAAAHLAAAATRSSALRYRFGQTG